MQLFGFLHNKIGKNAMKKNMLQRTHVKKSYQFSAFGCPTKQVCVEKCPDANHSPYLESKSPVANENAIKKYLEPYCDSAKYDSQMTLENLMKLQICPEWFVKSQPFFGRCVPFMPNNTSSDIFEKGWVCCMNFKKCLT